MPLPVRKRGSDKKKGLFPAEDIPGYCTELHAFVAFIVKESAWLACYKTPRKGFLGERAWEGVAGRDGGRERERQSEREREQEREREKEVPCVCVCECLCVCVCVRGVWELGVVYVPVLR